MPVKRTVLLVGVFCRYVSAAAPVVLMSIVLALTESFVADVPIAPVIAPAPAVPSVSLLVLLI